jgi:hypothetical protein
MKILEKTKTASASGVRSNPTSQAHVLKQTVESKQHVQSPRNSLASSQRSTGRLTDVCASR